jgi:hypothetical protein
LQLLLVAVVVVVAEQMVPLELLVLGQELVVAPAEQVQVLVQLQVHRQVAAAAADILAALLDHLVIVAAAELVV